MKMIAERNVKAVVAVLALASVCCSAHGAYRPSTERQSEHEVLATVLAAEYVKAVVPIFISSTTRALCIEDSVLDRVRVELADYNPLASFPEELFAGIESPCIDIEQIELDATTLRFPKGRFLPERDVVKATEDSEIAVTVWLSRVAFSKAGDQALMVITSSGSTYIDTECLVLQIVHDRWRIVARATIELLIY